MKKKDDSLKQNLTVKRKIEKIKNPTVKRINKLLKYHRFHITLLFTAFIFFYNYSFSQTDTYTDQDCLSCHGKPEISQITQSGKTRSVYVDPEKWSQDIHHNSKILCVDCHTNANPYFHFREGFPDVNCARCHPEEEEEYQKNVHLTFLKPSADKELPLCYHCHTKHHILRHDNLLSSINERNIGKTCGSCHSEVMVNGILKGTSLGKISGHRKGDISEKFDMMVCIKCHYEDSAHGNKRAYKDFCSRCHNPASKGNIVIGPTHLNSKRWANLNYTGGSLVLFILVGAFVFISYRSRKEISSKIKTFSSNMKNKEIKLSEEEVSDQNNKKELE